MVTNGFIQIVNNHIDTLTRAQKTLAKYILDHSETAAFSTAKQLAVATSQSDAAVIRFAKAIGFDGFPSMRAALREGLLARVGASGMQSQQAPRSDMDSLKQDQFAADQQLIADTMRLNETQTGITVADLLINARKIWVCAHGTTHPLASYLSLHLNQINNKTSLLNIGDPDLPTLLRQIQSDDVVIGIGYIRYLPHTSDILNIAKHQQAHIVAITDYPSSPLAALADHTFYVARNSSAFAWWSQAATMVLINWIVSLCMIRDADQVASMLRGADEIWEQLGYWNSKSNSLETSSLESHLQTGIKKRGNPTKAAMHPSTVVQRHSRKKEN